ncbi:MAG: DUF2937 family protein [Pseudomonadota bacterium]
MSCVNGYLVPMLLRTITIVLGMAGGLTASQLPEFVQQYSQRLGGAANELSSFVLAFDDDAARHDLTRREALDRYRETEDAFIGTRGERVVETVERYERLRDHRDALQEAGPFRRLFVFAQDYEPDLLQATYKDYQPAVPVTTEGFLHAAGGFLAGTTGAGLLFGIFRLFRRRLARPAG